MDINTVELITKVLEIIGTIAFAISGALVGIESKMDILGIAILGVTTACGGGILRDIILGITPPASFIDPTYITIAVITSLIIFIPRLRNKLMKRKNESDIKTLVLSGIILLFLFSCFVLCTYFPPKVNLFRDPVTNSYGINDK